MPCQLSRRPTSLDHQLYSLAITTKPTWLLSALNSYEEDPKAAKLIPQLSINVTTASPFQLKQSLLYYKDRIFMGNATDLREKFIFLYHSLALGGHSGVNSTYHRLKQHFTGLLCRQMS